MKTVQLLIFYCLVLLLLFSDCTAQISGSENLTEVNLKGTEASVVVADGITQFSGDFYSAVGTNSNRVNLVYSAFSMSAVFAMLKIGTKGETSRELQRVFHYPNPDPDDATLEKGFKRIFQSLDALSSSPNFNITSANRVYIDDKFKILGSYENAIREYFGGTNGGIVKLDLNNPSAASEINAWVEQVTRNKIRNLISPQALESDPQLVLVNAIYFLGQWENEFKKTDTRKEDFYLSDSPNDKIQVDMMFQNIAVEVADLPKLNVQVLALPYKGGRFTLLIYLPKTRDGLSTLKVGNLPSLPQIFSGMENEYVRLSMPKFKIETTLDLTQNLLKLGLQKVFNGDGDFTGLKSKANSSEKFGVTKAIQKAVIIVDEKGTEASATTAVVPGFIHPGIPPPPPPPPFKIDHPFYYQLVDKELNLVLFSGAVWRPQ